MSHSEKYSDDFEWIMKVLDSCLNISQVFLVVKLFESFKQKWIKKNSEIDKKLKKDYDQFKEEIRLKWGIFLN